MPVLHRTSLSQLLDRLRRATPLDDDGLLRCRPCHRPVTHVRLRMDDARRHWHFINPHGFEFTLQRFHQAPGCDILGQPTQADSWFPGFGWQLALCERCQEHLGWYFQQGENRQFFGLIQNRLIHSSAAPRPR